MSISITTENSLNIASMYKQLQSKESLNEAIDNIKLYYLMIDEKKDEKVQPIHYNKIYQKLAKAFSLYSDLIKNKDFNTNEKNALLLEALGKHGLIQSYKQSSYYVNSILPQYDTNINQSKKYTNTISTIAKANKIKANLKTNKDYKTIKLEEVILDIDTSFIKSLNILADVNNVDQSYHSILSKQVNTGRFNNSYIGKDNTLNNLSGIISDFGNMSKRFVTEIKDESGRLSELATLGSSDFFKVKYSEDNNYRDIEPEWLIISREVGNVTSPMYSGRKFKSGAFIENIRNNMESSNFTPIEDYSKEAISRPSVDSLGYLLGSNISIDNNNNGINDDKDKHIDLSEKLIVKFIEDDGVITIDKSYSVPVFTSRSVERLFKSGDDFQQNRFDVIFDFTNSININTSADFFSPIINDLKDVLNFKDGNTIKDCVNNTSFMVRIEGIDVPQPKSDTYSIPMLFFDVKKVKTTVAFERKATLNIRLDESLYYNTVINYISNNNTDISKDDKHIYSNNIGKFAPFCSAVLSLKYLDYKCLNIYVKHLEKSVNINNIKVIEANPYWCFEDCKFLGQSNSIDFNRDSASTLIGSYPFIFKRLHKSK